MKEAMNKSTKPLQKTKQRFKERQILLLQSWKILHYHFDRVPKFISHVI